MQQLIYFIQKYKYFLFFLLLEFVAIYFIINNHSFHKSKFISSANAISGGLYEKVSKFSEYFDLKKTNEALANENVYLRNELQKMRESMDTTMTFMNKDSLTYHQKFTYTPATVRNNKFSTSFNFLTIDRGEKHGISAEMAVTNDNGIVGITDASSQSYARVQSILNKDIKINARLKNSTYFGTLSWNGKDIRTVQLNDIPRQATYKVGDTIITGGMSAIFPEGILIGTISKVHTGSSITNTIDVSLFNDMRKIKHVYVISNFDKKEIRTLENRENE